MGEKGEAGTLAVQYSDVLDVERQHFLMDFGDWRGRVGFLDVLLGRYDVRCGRED
jgi:hypothetical protein